MLKGIPTVNTPDSAKEFRTEILQKLREELDADDWTKVHFDDPKGGDITLRERPGRKGLHTVCITATIPAPAQQVFSFVNSTDATVKQRLDKHLAEMTTLMEVDDTTSIVHFVYASRRMLVSDRDFVMVQGGFCDDQGVYWSFGHSVNYGDGYDLGYVRGFTLNNWRITPKDAGSCTVECLALVDPRGWIPKSVVDAMKSYPAKKFAKLREFFRQLNAQ